MAKILCLETATTVCSVVLFDDKNLISSRELNEGFSHSEKLTVFIEEVLNEASLSFSDIDAIAISNGPGSYTGLRIGMSVAKGISFACDLPLIVVPTLETMAARAVHELNSDTKLFCPMIDARRMEVYCALFDADLNQLKSAEAVVVDENFFEGVIGEVFFFGDGAEKCKGTLKENFIYAENIFPSARFMGALALKRFESGIFENVSLVEPVYLKEYRAGSKKN